MNDVDEFGKAFLEIYPTELELKVEQNGSHATFLDLDISIDKGKFIHKMFDKWDAFNFHIVKVPSTTSKIPEFVRIDRSTLLLKEFLPVAKNLLDRMISQGGSKRMLLK